MRLLQLYRQEVAVMVFGTDAARKPDKTWRSPPWTVEAAPWQAIGQLLPAGHLARRIRTFVLGLDLDELRRSYLGVGKQPFPPGLMLMVVLYEMQRGQLHPCRWAEDCRFSDPVKWLAMGLQPSASYFYAFRKRLAPYVETWNQQLIRRAVAEGATQGNEAAIDGTFVAALGSRHRLLKAKTLGQRNQTLCQALAADRRAARTRPAVVAASLGSNHPVASSPACAARSAEQAAAAEKAETPADTAPVAERSVRPVPWPYWMAKTPRGRGRQLYRYRQAQQRLDALLTVHAQRENRKAKGKRRRPDQVRICPSEPEAALGRDKLKTFRPLYNVQLASDLNTSLIIDYGLYASNTDAGLFIPTVQRLRQTLGRAPQRVLVDGLYATAANLAYCDEHGVTLYAPAADRPAAAAKVAAPAKPKQLGKEHFRWDPAEKTYYCPEGHRLVLIGSKAEKREQDQEVWVAQYRCPPQHCQACPRAAACTQAPHKGRTIKRCEHEEKIEALRQRMQTPEAEALYKKRSQSVEPRIADLKTHRGLRCFAAFGKALAMVQVGLLVLVHNALCLLTGPEPSSSNVPPASPPAGSSQSPADPPTVGNAEASRSQGPRPQTPT